MPPQMPPPGTQQSRSAAGPPDEVDNDGSGHDLVHLKYELTSQVSPPSLTDVRQRPFSSLAWTNDTWGDLWRMNFDQVCRPA
jgi:hypothetical protein